MLLSPQHMYNEEVTSARRLCFWQYQDSTVGRTASYQEANSFPWAVVSTSAIRELEQFVLRVVEKRLEIVQVFRQEMYVKSTQYFVGNFICLPISIWHCIIKSVIIVYISWHIYHGIVLSKRHKV
jgi:hypothetical protein